MSYFSSSDLHNVVKYHGGTTIDRSLIYKYLVSPLCAQLVAWSPSWLAPNVMTLGGLVCNILAFLLALFYIPTLDSEASGWIYVAMAMLILIYMLLDNMDGKQSVRTGTSSPLGELLDHGCDSFTVGLGSVVTAAVVQGGPWAPLGYIAPGMVAFYLAHWQEYFNHYLDLGYLGPTEAESFAIVLYLITAYFGPAIWTDTYTVGPLSFKGNQVVLYGILFSTGYAVITSIYSGLELARKKHNVPASTALSQLIPFTTSWIFGFLWIHSAPLLYENHPFLFVTLFNLIFSYLVISCIVQRICSLSYSYFYYPMIPLILASLNSIARGYFGLVLANEETVMYLTWVFYFFQFLHFSYSIITGFCTQLKINFVTIPYPNKGTKKN